MRRKAIIALCLLTALATAALTSAGYGGDLRLKDPPGKQAILFLPQHFESVPWLGLKTAPGQKTDFPIGINGGTMEALRSLDEEAREERPRQIQEAAAHQRSDGSLDRSAEPGARR